MNFLSDKLYKYILHECIIDEIINEQSNVKFIFKEGIYSIN